MPKNKTDSENFNRKANPEATTSDEPTPINTKNLFSTFVAATLPPREALPQDIQEFLAETEAKPFEEKLQAVSEFRYFLFRPQYESDIPRTFEDLALGEIYVGDCDDFAVFSMGLLEYLDIPEKDIRFVAGEVEYESMFGSTRGAHAFVIVKNEAGDAFIIDNNLNGANPIDTNTLPGRFEGESFHPETGEPFAQTVTIHSTFFTIDASGKYTKLSDIPEELQRTPLSVYGPDGKLIHEVKIPKDVYDHPTSEEPAQARTSATVEPRDKQDTPPILADSRP